MDELQTEKPFRLCCAATWCLVYASALALQVFFVRCSKSALALSKSLLCWRWRAVCTWSLAHRLHLPST